MNHLPKHLRPRWRYLVVGLESRPDASLNRRAFQRAVWYAARNLVGEVGSAALDLTVQRLSDAGGGAWEAVVRVHRDEVDRARAVLACLDTVDDDPVGLRIRGVGGTIRACEEKYMRRERKKRTQSHVTFAGESRTASVGADRGVVDVDGTPVGVTTLDI